MKRGFVDGDMSLPEGEIIMNEYVSSLSISLCRDNLGSSFVDTALKENESFTGFSKLISFPFSTEMDI